MEANELTLVLAANPQMRAKLIQVFLLSAVEKLNSVYQPTC
jgi:hypothetical protein